MIFRIAFFLFVFVPFMLVVIPLQALVLLKRRGGISTDPLHHITVHDEDVLERAC